MIQLSKHFTLDEFLKSRTAVRLGINNIPNEEQLENIRLLVENLLEPLRAHYGRPIIITSGFRSAELNKAVGGVKNSQHCTGQAADIRSVSDRRSDNKELFDMIIEMGLEFDQLINEYDFNWIHVSFANKNRNQILHVK